jgi:aminopeptidase N
VDLGVGVTWCAGRWYDAGNAARADPAAGPARRATATPEQIAENERRARLRGEYSRYRANNDLLYYHLDVRIDPAKKLVTGKNTIRFKMLSDDTRIQLDLYANLNVDRIVQGGTELKYSRDVNTVYVDFPSTLKSGSLQSIDFFYSGTPTQTGRFGGFVFGKDPAGRDWIYTACEGEGAAIWWPNKDQWHDEVENMDLSVAIPSALTDASNGRFVRKTDLGDGFTRWDWKINYPINNYNVSVNIAAYQHWQRRSAT